MQIIVTGNPVDGLRFHGPFVDSERATDWAAIECEDHWNVAELHEPVGGADDDEEPRTGLRKFLIEGSEDGGLFAETIEAESQEQAEDMAIDRLCEAWGHVRDAETGLWDLGDCARVTEYTAEDYARDAAPDMLAFVEMIGRMTLASEGEGDMSEDIESLLDSLIERARKLAATARGEA